MPLVKYLKVFIGGRQVDLVSARDIPISISYKLEDPSNFQSKKSSESPSIVIPATTINDQVANTFHNPGVEDMSPDQQYRSFQSALIEANGYELLVGKCILTNARHASCPVDYEFDFYGNNADWIIPLKESTLYEFLQDITFPYTKDTIEDSWVFDGLDEDLPYVFAPVRYGQAMETYPQDMVVGNEPLITDYNMRADYMKPSLSVYWLLYRGFKSLGYRISSDFFNTNYFRRLVMPWTWGNFLFFDSSRQDNLDFLAKSSNPFWVDGDDVTGYIDLYVNNELSDGAFDNNGVYNYDSPNKEMEWTYLPAFNYGTLDATFHFAAFIDAKVTSNSEVTLALRWFKNGVQVAEDILLELIAPAVTIGPGKIFVGVVDKYKTFSVVSTDVISCKVFADISDSAFGNAKCSMRVDAFELEYLRIPLGGTIDFERMDALKKYKFLDFVAGVIDAFNISPQTDPINKVVYLEPLHPYSLTNDLAIRTGGYFNGNYLDWNSKQDVSQLSDLPLFSDGEREQLFTFKPDTNDGLLKKVQDRYSFKAGHGKFVLPERFKDGKHNNENRFFSSVVHCELLQWKGFGSDANASPQIVCLVPENISNTSRDEAQNTFAPKLCWYKGPVDHVGWNFDGDTLSEFPFMFGVNYQPGGQNDPILSYSDERIGPEGAYEIGKGLLRRFFLQRMAITRNGQHYITPFRLNNIDVTNWLHREHVICRGQKWELVEINDYKPLREESTQCTLRKWAAITPEDAGNVFPSNDTVLDNPPTEKFDIKYAPMKCLVSDIPIIQ